MKQMHLFSAALVLIMTAALTSCKPSKVWKIKDKDKTPEDKEYSERRNDRRDDDYEDPNFDRTPPPQTSRYYSYTPLVISPTPGFVMNRYPDGRFYHRSSQGFLYWKAPDNRFFLDKSYIHRVRYSRNDYEQWRRYYYPY